MCSYCSVAQDAFHAEADETTLALEDEPWDLPIESDVTSDPNVEKEDLSWEMLVMATAEFAAPASDNKSKNLPEQKASSTLEEHIQKQHQVGSLATLSTVGGVMPGLPTHDVSCIHSEQ